MSCSTIAIVGGIIIVLLILACHFDPISRYERETRKFERWKRDLERRRQDDDDPPPEDPE